VQGYGFDGDNGYNSLKNLEFKIILENYEKLLTGNRVSNMK